MGSQLYPETADRVSSLLGEQMVDCKDLHESYKIAPLERRAILLTTVDG